MTVFLVCLKDRLYIGLVDKFNFNFGLLWVSFGTFSFLSMLQEKQPKKSPTLARFQDWLRTHPNVVNAQYKHVIHYFGGGVKKWSCFLSNDKEKKLTL